MLHGVCETAVSCVKYEVDGFTRATTDFSKGGKSPVWAHFGFQLGDDGKVADEKHVVCKICQAKVGYSRNTTNLKQHL